MKKIFSILFAGVMALTAVSCFNEPLAVFDPANGTAPIMGTVDVGAKNVTVTYTPGTFNMGFNEEMAPTHTLAVVSIDGTPVSRIITTKDDGVSLVATNVNISKVLSFYGYNDGIQIGSLGIVVRASIQDPTKDNGRNGYLDSDVYTISNFVVTLPVGSPYADYTEASTWSVIGKLSNYDIDWNGDLPMITDGKTHVAQGIKLSASDEFKFRKDQDWAVNMGGELGSLGSEFTVTQDGPNIKVPQDGIYDLILDPNGSATIVETLGGGVSNKIGGDEPEPEPVTVTGWNVIGANGDWENDLIASEKDGVWTAYINAPEATTFKWRKDAGWDENYGGTLVTLGEPFAAVAGGDDIHIDAGFWKTELNLTNETNPTITVSSGDVYGLIGVNGDWNNDIFMTLTDGKWVSPATKISGEFKIRYNAAWDVNYGGVMEELGKAFEAVPNGDNIKVEDGEYIVTFDPSAKTITVDAAMPSNLWSVIGDFNGWGADAYMTQVAPGIWVSDELELTEAGWKIRFNNSWDVNRGGATPEKAGEFVAAYPGGDDIKIGGKGRVVFNEMNQTIGLLGWGVVGKVASIEGFEWNNDIPMNLAADGKWYSVPVKYTKDDEIKIRFGAAWGEDFGGNATAADEAFATGGDNIKIPADGTYMVVYDPTASTITLSTDFWSLIGDFSEWKADRFMLPLGEGKWAAYNQEIATGGWKIRKGADWTVSAGGTYAAAGEPFDGVTDNGDNIAVTDMTRFDVLYDTAAGKITVSKPVK